MATARFKHIRGLFVFAFKRRGVLFIMTKDNMRILGVSHCFKLQNNT